MKRPLGVWKFLWEKVCGSGESKEKEGGGGRIEKRVGLSLFPRFYSSPTTPDVLCGYFSSSFLEVGEEEETNFALFAIPSAACLLPTPPSGLQVTGNQLRVQHSPFARFGSKRTCLAQNQRSFFPATVWVISYIRRPLLKSGVGTFSSFFRYRSWYRGWRLGIG